MKETDYNLTFCVRHKGEEPTTAELREALLRRIQDLDQSDSWHEGCDPGETIESEEDAL